MSFAKSLKTKTYFPRSLRAALLLGALSGPAMADTGSFIAGLWPEARAMGVPRTVFDTALAGWRPSERIVELSRSQPEFAQGVGAYLAQRVTGQRVAEGRRQAQEWTRTLAAIERKYGVEAKAILAIWGMETDFGGFTGNTNTVAALATLAYDGSRKSYFRGELLTALTIISDGHVRPQEMIGSWAGAMGQTQFMPSSFRRYAVDHNNDGRIDIWTSIPDALASTANYLKEHGWRSGETWGYEVKLPAGFNYSKAWSMGTEPISTWTNMGITRPGGRGFPRPADVARLYLPAGSDGPVFLLLANFDVLKSYNNSNSYALAVGHLADRIAGGGGFSAGWPQDDRPLNAAQRKEVQALLGQRGFDAGTADGVFGPRTRSAIMAYQARAGLRADGYASSRLLLSLR